MLPGKRNYTCFTTKTRQYWQQQAGGYHIILCYLRNVTREQGGCYSSTTSRIRFTWKEFHELIPTVCNKSFSLANRGHIYNCYVRSVLLYACETWPLNVKDLLRLPNADNSTVRWIYSVKISDRYSKHELKEKLKVSKSI